MAWTKVKRLAVATFASVAIAAGGLATAAPASADGPGTCYQGDGCLWFQAGYNGASYDLGNNWSDLAGLHFGCAGGGNCPGNGVPVKNNALSAANYNSGNVLCIFYNSEWLGSWDWMAVYGQPGWYKVLSSTSDNDASNLFDVATDSTCP